MRPAQVSMVINDETGIISGPLTTHSMMVPLHQWVLVLDSEDLRKEVMREDSEDKFWKLFFRATLPIRHGWVEEGRLIARSAGSRGRLSPFSDFRESV